MASGASIDSTSSDKDKGPSYSGPPPRRDGPHLQRTSEALLASWSSRFGARLGTGASGALTRAHTAGSRNCTRAAEGRGRGATGTGAGGDAFVLQALLALRAHHAEALAALAGSAAAARHSGGTGPRSRRAARRASAVAGATGRGPGALRHRHAG